MSTSSFKIVTLAKTKSTKDGGLMKCCNINKLILLCYNKRDIYLYKIENTKLVFKQRWKLESDIIHLSIKSGDTISKSTYYALDICGTIYELKMDEEYKANKKKRTFGSVSSQDPNEIQNREQQYKHIFQYKGANSILHMGNAFLITSTHGPNVQLFIKDKIENSFFNNPGLCYSSVFAPNTISMFGVNLLSPNFFKILFGEEFSLKPQLILISGFKDGRLLFSPLSKGRKSLEYNLFNLNEEIVNIIPFCTVGSASNGLLFIGNCGKVHIIWEDNVLHSTQVNLNMPISKCIIIDKSLIFLSQSSLWYSNIKIDGNEISLSIPQQANIKQLIADIFIVKSNIILYTYHGEIISIDKSTILSPSIACKKKVSDFQLKELLSQLSEISSKQEYMKEKNQKLNTSIEKINSALHTMSDMINQKSVICLIHPKVNIFSPDINKNLTLQIKLIFKTKVKDESLWTLYLRVTQLNSTMVYSLKLSNFLLTKKSELQSNYLISLPINTYSLSDILITSYLSFTISNPSEEEVQLKSGFYKDHVNGIEYDIMIFLNSYRLNLLDLLYHQKHDDISLYVNQPQRKLTLNEYITQLNPNNKIQLNTSNLLQNITLKINNIPNISNKIYKSLGDILGIKQLNDLTDALLYSQFLDQIRFKQIKEEKQCHIQIHSKGELIPYLRSLCLHRLCESLKKIKHGSNEEDQTESNNYRVKLSGNLISRINALSSSINQLEKDVEKLYLHTIGDYASPFESNTLLINNYNHIMKIYVDLREFTDKNLEI